MSKKISNVDDSSLPEDLCQYQEVYQADLLPYKEENKECTCKDYEESQVGYH